ncbi:zf-HC2 domain-containing protein [Solwaraspora sp. WMMD791]|uniref:anti-sigma factor family protein n=1 Tax=Solwaraspora sp. WMMD791 TaxID=3016086 RepID=UPI00249BF9B9|nr:zf-HC2 domain-containing protein [Solwaraspora sp. WMMD791]WFE27576.1 zf-HC2 domain-containing protein [Solwaraspora sp. WMMD791]
MTRSAHWDVGAYALGALDADDVERFEEHLAGCWACAAELESLIPIVGLMSTVDIGQLEGSSALPPHSPAGVDLPGGATDSGDDVPPPAWAGGESGTDRRRDHGQVLPLDRARSSRRRLLASRPAQIAAGFVLMATLTGGSFLVGAQWFGADTTTVPQADGGTSVTAGPSPLGPQSGVGGPEVTGEKFSTVDPTTGVEADVVLEEAGWGTQVSFALRRVPGPMQCRLVVIRASGTAEVLSTWAVPETGYGTPEQPAPLLLTTSTAAPRDDIERIQVQAVDQSGVATALVTVPV